MISTIGLKTGTSINNDFITPSYINPYYNNDYKTISKEDVDIVTCNVFIQIIKSIESDLNLTFFEELINTKNSDEIKVAIEGLKVTLNQVLKIKRST